MIIGIELDYWAAQIEEWLSKAAAYSPEPVELLGEHELLWTVRRWEGNPPTAMLRAAATTRLTDDCAEIILIGGEGLEWVGPLSERIAAWARDEGKPCVRAAGRKGWVKVLSKHGWQVMGERDGIYAFERGC